MRSLVSLLRAALVALTLGLGAAPAQASQAPATGNLEAQALRVASTAQLKQELRAAQSSVDAALAARKARSDAWQAATKARDAASAVVDQKKRQGAARSDVEAALRAAFALDERAAQARADLAAAESQVAERGARLLALYDQLLTRQRKHVESQPAGSAARDTAVSTWRQLAAQRDRVRGVLLPVLQDAGAVTGDLDLDVADDDDVEQLLEKADLARDLEARYLRRVEAVRRRIREVMEEQAVAKDVTGLIGRSQLFDEEDRRLVVLRADPRVTGGGGGNNNGAAPDRGVNQPPPAESDGEGAESVDDGVDPNIDAEAPGFVAQPPNVVGNLPDASAQALPALAAAEQAFLGAGGASDAQLIDLMAKGRLNLSELRALEKKLQARAGAMSAKKQQLKREAEERSR